MSGDYCSYHSIFNAQQINNLLPATSQLSGVGSVNINYAVVPIPHPTISPACLFNPNTAHSKPWPGQNQALVGDVGNSITIMLHELVEAILNEAWYDSDGEEVMDKCVGTFSNVS